MTNPQPEAQPAAQPAPDPGAQAPRPQTPPDASAQPPPRAAPRTPPQRPPRTPPQRPVQRPPEAAAAQAAQAQTAQAQAAQAQAAEPKAAAQPGAGAAGAQPESSVFVPATKVLSAEEMKVLRIADRFRDEARRLHDGMGRSVAEAQEQARRKGYQEGFEKGRLEALETLVEAIDRVRERLAASDEELAGIVLGAVERMLGEMDEHELALRCVRRALDDAAGDIWAVVRVTPDEVPYLEEGLRQLPMTGTWPEIKGVEADPLLKRGEIILETPKGRIHVGMRQQLSRLKAGLQSLDE